MNEIFLDTAYAIALASVSDAFHGRAMLLAEQIEKANTRLVTTHAVALEIGNALSRQRYRAAATQLLAALEADPTIEIIPLTEDLYVRGLHLYQQRSDKDWGLTDCVSFIVMRDRGLSDALTTDEHFQQAGYRTLMRESG